MAIRPLHALGVTFGVALALSLTCGAQARPERQAELTRTLSPYFHVTSADAAPDQLPLKRTWAQVDVVGVIADVTVFQEYSNDGKTALEAIYIFPASTRAAVHGMTMTVGERVVEAEIREREQAREEYEQALQNGQTASLLEQQRPNVFQMNVGNIQPGDEITVELRYTELLVPQDQVYEFVYPTVVGPRYSNVPHDEAPVDEHWVANPYLHEGEEGLHTFGLELQLHTGIELAKLYSPTHAVDVHYTGSRQAQVWIDDSAEAGNRDFVLRYSLGGDDIEGGLLLYPGEEENFFLLMMEPPARVTPKRIVPREVIFIVDVSGSMSGFPLNVTHELMRGLLAQLRPQDYFNVLFFAGDAALLSEASLPATTDHVDGAMDAIARMSGGGGTELLPALDTALGLPRPEAGISRTIVVATDGYVTVETEAFERVRASLGDANLFSFGIGSSVNRFLVEGLARAGMGEPFVALDLPGAREQARRFQDYVAAPVLQGIDVEFDGFDAYDVEPAAVPDLFVARPVVVFGKYDGEPEGEIVVSGYNADGPCEQVFYVDEGIVSEDNEALRPLWARHRVTRLTDLNSLEGDGELIEEVTELGLEYDLLTAYTSFVAVDRRVRGDGDPETVKQPLPLPDGVSDEAVGGTIGVSSGGTSSLSGLGTRGSGHGVGGAGYGRSGGTRFPAAKGGGISIVDLGASTDGTTSPVIRGSLDKSVIDRVLKQHINQIRYCYEKGLQRDPNLAGKVVVRFVVDRNGTVASVTIKSSTLGDDKVEECILRAMEALVFPQPKGGGVVIVNYPFVFQSAS